MPSPPTGWKRVERVVADRVKYSARLDKRRQFQDAVSVEDRRFERPGSASRDCRPIGCCRQTFPCHSRAKFAGRRAGFPARPAGSWRRTGPRCPPVCTGRRDGPQHDPVAGPEERQQLPTKLGVGEELPKRRSTTPANALAEPPEVGISTESRVSYETIRRFIISLPPSNPLSVGKVVPIKGRLLVNAPLSIRS